MQNATFCDFLHEMKLACVTDVRRGRKEEKQAREARERRSDAGGSRYVPSPSRPSPSRAHFDFPPFLRPATQAKTKQKS